MTPRETLDMMRRSVEALVVEEDSVLGRLAAIGKHSLAPEGAISFSQDWKVIWADDVMHKLAGYDGGELIGKSLSDLLGTQHQDAWLQIAHAKVASGEPTSQWDTPLVFPLRTKDGDEKAMLVRLSLQPVLGKTVFVIHMRAPGSLLDNDVTR